MNAMIAYATHQIVKKFADPETGEVDGLWFNKVITLLNYRLRDEYSKDMKLPHSWYFWGNKIEPCLMPKQLVLDSHDEDGGKSRFHWDGESPEEPNLSDRKAIRSTLDSIYSRFPMTKDGKRAILDANYQYAPYEFQRAYAAFRTDANEVVDIQMEALKRGLLRGDLAAAMDRFPFDDFPDLQVPAAKIRILGDALLAQGKEKPAIMITKDFWESFCKRLRIIKGKGNQNVPDSLIAHWKKDAVDHFQKYDAKLKLDIKTILQREKLPQITDNPVMSAFLNPDDWGEGTEDSSTMIDHAAYQ
jgi:hypothetical protein